MPTHALDVVKAFFQAIESQNTKELGNHLSGDFVMSGGITPLNKYQFLNLVSALNQNMASLSFDIQNIQEDNQYPQSDRVDVDFLLRGDQSVAMQPLIQEGTAQREQDKTLKATLERLSFTAMGDMIASIVTANPQESYFTRILTHLQQEVHDEEETALPDRGPNESLKQGDLSERASREEHLDKQGYERYNRQSNLYDPENKSYTPSQNVRDYAPQVDAYRLNQGRSDDPAAPLFRSEQEQDELTRREPNKQEEQEE